MSPPSPVASTGTVATTCGGLSGATRRIRPVVRSATSAACPPGSVTTAATGARHVATTCGSGSTHGPGVATGPPGGGAAGGDGSEGAGDCGEGTFSAPISGLSRHGCDDASGNRAQPAARRASTTSSAAAAPRTVRVRAVRRGRRPSGTRDHGPDTGGQPRRRRLSPP